MTVPTHTIAGTTFRSAQVTADHLTATIAALAVAHPSARLRILQPCYNVGVAASAGTHDLDRCFDFEIDGLDWWAAQRFLRSQGWGCWFRHLGTWAAKSAWHIHAVSLPAGLSNRPTLAQVVAAFKASGTPVGEFVPGQVVDYFTHAFGLKDMHRAGSDTSWFPPDIAATIFDHAAYTAAKVAAGQPTMLDVTTALAKFAATTGNPKAAPIYQRARTIVGKLVRDKSSHRVPETTAEVIAVLAAKRKATPLTAVWTRYRLTTVIRLLRPLALVTRSLQRGCKDVKGGTPC